MRINRIQVIGSHNSYHVGPTPEALATLEKLVTDLKLDVGDPKELDYTHSPLEDQLARGIRSFELDLSLPANLSGDIKVAHIEAIDEGSRCPTLAQCLGQLMAWSKENPRHVPIPVLLELKGQSLDATQSDFLDAALRAAIPAAQLIEPDEVRGEAATLRDAVESNGWPELDASRGSFYFLLDNGGEVSAGYRDGHPQLQGRAIFTTDALADDSTIRDDGAVLKLNDPEQIETIKDVVSKGHIVRTRADGPNSPSPSGRTKALASGAQIVSTDYPAGEADTDGYEVSLDQPARCNPVAKPASCPTDVEGALSE